MAEKLVATVEKRRGGANVIKLSGSLDEHNRLAELIEHPGTGRALVNLAGVERINSSGTRDWLDWLAALEAKGTQLELVACSPAFVAQLNHVENLARNALVKSFQAPYQCATCEMSKLLLVNVADMGAAPYVPPPCECDTCGGAMTFADDAATYFRFVAAAQQRIVESERKADSAPPKLARGSTASGMDEPDKRLILPRVPTRASSPSLSVFQMPSADRTSRRELLPPPALRPNDRPYLIAVVGLLVCTVAVLVYLLLVR